MCNLWDNVFGSRSWRMLGFCLSEYCDFIQQGIRPIMLVWRITYVEIYWGRMNSVRCQAFSLSLARKIRHKFPSLYHRLLLMLHCSVLHFCSVIGGCFLLLTFIVCFDFFAIVMCNLWHNVQHVEGSQYLGEVEVEGC